ncbi:MAG: WD40 repeat domain-containing protein [Clostridiales bacterium]|nr:WD40 repeat domain-containing protein [Clostridiales bacterium]
MLGCSYPDLRQRDREYKMRRLFALLSVCLVLAIGFGAFAAWQYRQIQENYYQLQVNRARYLAKTSLELLESGDRIRAIQVAMEALPDEENPDRPAITEAEYALNRALYSYQFDSNLKSSRVLEPERDFDSGNLFLSPDGKNLLILDNNKDLSVWSLDTLLCIWEMNEIDSDGAIGDCIYADFLSDDEIIAAFSGSMNYIVRMNFVTGEKIYRVDLPVIYFTSSDCQLSPGGRWLAINSGEKVVLAEISEGTLSELQYPEEYAGNMELGPHAMGLAFSQDEEKMVVFFSDESTSFRKPYDVYVWDIENGECMGLTTENGSTYSSCFLSNGDIVVLSKNYDIQESFGGMFGTYSIGCYSGKDLQLLWNYNGIGTLSRSGEYKVESQKISIDNQKMEGVICTVANQLLVLRVDTGEVIDTKSFSGNIIGVYSVYLSDMESCDRLTVGVEDGTIYLSTFSKGSMYLLLSITAEDGEREGDNGKFIWNDVEKMGIMSTGHDNKIYLSEQVFDPDYTVLNNGEYFAWKFGFITLGDEQVYPYNSIYISSDPDEFKLYITDVDTGDILLEETGTDFSGLGTIECADQFYLITYWRDLNKNSLIRVHDTIKFETLYEIGLDQAHILEGYHSDDDLVSFHHKLEILDLSETNEIWKINLETGAESMVLDKSSLKICGVDGIISNAYISNDDRYLVIETYDIFSGEGFFVQDLDSGQMVADQWFRMGSKGDLALSDDGSLIAYYAPGNGIVVADISTMEILQEIPFKSGSKANFWFIKNDRYLLIESDTGYLYSWDLNNQCKAAEDSMRVSSNGKCHSSDDIFVIEEYNFESLKNIGYFTDFTEHVYRVEDDGSFSRYLDLPNSFYCGDYVMSINGNRSVVYRLRTLEESLAYAKEVTEDRELSEMDKIKYFIEQ